jgi:hypothetical protein
MARVSPASPDEICVPAQRGPQRNDQAQLAELAELAELAARP